MRIIIVGGGSGGHITPAVAVTREILEARPRAKVEFWTDFKYYKNVTKLTTELDVSWHIRTRRLLAGKFHRYAGWKLKDYFLHFDITLKDLIWGNFLGFLGFLGGILVSFGRLIRKDRRPDAIFLKGGYVCLPVGLVAKLLRIPYIIHESDTVPGLANRILMNGAEKVAFGMPLNKEVLEKHKNYVFTGIPVGAEFRAVTEARQKSLKKAFSFETERPLVVITGGSQGSENLNETTRKILPELLKKCSVGLIAGRKQYEDMIDLKKYESWKNANLESNFRMWEFCTTMDELLGAADIIVSRAGATTIAEMAALRKTTILVPFEKLPGGHQVKNAERLVEAGAVEMILDSEMVAEPEKLSEMILKLVKKPELRREMAEKLHEEAKGDAARRLAELVLEAADKK